MANSQELFLNEIITPRLKLFCLTRVHLQLILDDPNLLEKTLGFAITREALTPAVHRAVRMKLKKMETAPAPDFPWFTYWMIWVRESHFGAGLIGFKGILPGPSDVEIGYGISPAYQNRGYTTEAVQALVAWAFGDPRCTGIYANVLRTNPASSKVLEKAGFGCQSTSPEAIFWRLTRSG